MNRKLGRKPRPSKTDINVDIVTVRKSKADPSKSSREIMIEVNEVYGVDVLRKLVEKRPKEAQLFERINRKKQLSKCHIKTRIIFAEAYRNKPAQLWKNVFWSDETRWKNNYTSSTKSSLNPR